jgi:hypothetical protein
MVAPQVLPDVIRPGLTSSPGDIVISDNLVVHKSAAADKAIRAKGRPASLSAALQSRRRPTVPTSIRSRRLSPSLRVLLRARAIRTIDALWRAIGEICDLFSRPKRQNQFAAAGYRFE